MKNFLNRIFQAVLTWILRIYDSFVILLTRVGIDKYLHFIAGMLIALPVAFLCPQGTKFLCFIPALFAGLFKDALDLWRGHSFDWFDVLATALGGVVVALFSFIPPIA